MVTSHAVDEPSAEMMMEERWPYYARLKLNLNGVAELRLCQHVGPELPDRKLSPSSQQPTAKCQY
jgi:hypothetical protein